MFHLNWCPISSMWKGHIFFSTPEFHLEMMAVKIVPPRRMRQQQTFRNEGGKHWTVKFPQDARSMDEFLYEFMDASIFGTMTPLKNCHPNKNQAP